MSKFKIGDKVRCSYKQYFGEDNGIIGTVTHINGQRMTVNNLLSHEVDFIMFGGAFELVEEDKTPDFDLKTMPWVIYVSSEAENKAALEWLFEMGMNWAFSPNEILWYGQEQLTNVGSDGEIERHIMHGIGKAEPEAKEIKLKYETKTSVVGVEWSVVETEKDKAIRELEETINNAKLQIEALKNIKEMK